MRYLIILMVVALSSCVLALEYSFIDDKTILKDTKFIEISNANSILTIISDSNYYFEKDNKYSYLQKDNMLSASFINTTHHENVTCQNGCIAFGNKICDRHFTTKQFQFTNEITYRLCNEYQKNETNQLLFWFDTKNDSKIRVEWLGELDPTITIEVTNVSVGVFTNTTGNDGSTVQLHENDNLTSLIDEAVLYLRFDNSTRYSNDGFYPSSSLSSGAGNDCFRNGSGIRCEQGSGQKYISDHDIDNYFTADLTIHFKIKIDSFIASSKLSRQSSGIISFDISGTNLRAYHWADTNGVCLSTSVSNIPTGEWISLTYVKDNTLSQGRIYLNGVNYENDSCTVGNFDNTSTNPLGIMGGHDGNEQFNGTGNTFGLWNRTLSQEEITNLVESDKFHLSGDMISIVTNLSGDGVAQNLTGVDLINITPSGSTLNGEWSTINVNESYFIDKFAGLYLFSGELGEWTNTDLQDRAENYMGNMGNLQTYTFSDVSTVSTITEEGLKMVCEADNDNSCVRASTVENLPDFDDGTFIIMNIKFPNDYNGDFFEKDGSHSVGDGCGNLQYGISSSKLQLRLYDGDVWDGYKYITDINNVIENKWYKIAINYNGNSTYGDENLSVYIDGNYVGSWIGKFGCQKSIYYGGGLNCRDSVNNTLKSIIQLNYSLTNSQILEMFDDKNNWTPFSTDVQTGNFVKSKLSFTSTGENTSILTSINYTINEDGNVTPPTDTCTYSSGNWLVDCSDNCIVNEVVELGGNNLTLTGTGNFKAEAEIRDINYLFFTPSCTIFHNNTLFFEGGS